MNYIIINYGHTISNYAHLDKAIEDCFNDLKIAYRCINRQYRFKKSVFTYKILSELLNTSRIVTALSEAERTEIVNTCCLMNSLRK